MPESVYQNRVLGYFDILGWSELIRESERRPEIISDLEAAIKAAAEGWEERHQTPQHIVQFAQFSDHVCISSLADRENAITFVAIAVGALTLRLLNMGYPTRGALVAGPLFHTGNRIFGPALVEAHEIESKVAKYPRLVFSDRALQLAGSVPPPARVLRRQDVDGLMFLDLFAALDTADDVERVRRAIEGRPPPRETLDVRAKRSWLLEYLRKRKEELRSA
jgi:hypothetical protein